ncbi:hypothetical protein [Granulibacter bethesdensis]|uniref:hypothetical protein n=1 Tax=Granulibacter bethesdensis TaxID=364410 RepID=UPI00090B9797|nr:hypothetical protein [Granulibacter bethesdensis]APH60707.1 Multimodular transpeptidase-transglycosylase [Granulibacter bethesdensis]
MPRLRGHSLYAMAFDHALAALWAAGMTVWLPERPITYETATSYGLRDAWPVYDAGQSGAVGFGGNTG